MDVNKLIVILGPTASGKSELGVRLARKFGAEVISADSRQMYRGLDIGTAKMTKRAKRGIAHYCLDIASPKKVFTVVDFKKCADRAIEEIRRKRKIPILVGGTGFYIRAVVDGLVLPHVPPNPKLRKILEKKSTEELFQELQRKDPKRAQTIERKNKRRLIRALEIIAALGKVPKLQREQKYDALFIGIKRTPQELKTRIKKRIVAMLKKGLVREVQNLRKLGLSWKRIFELGFEYKYPALYIQKKISKDEMKEMLVRASLDYVRRQMVWWKNDKRIHWISKPKGAERLVKQFISPSKIPLF